jgi:hypothetical protein
MFILKKKAIPEPDDVVTTTIIKLDVVKTLAEEISTTPTTTPKLRHLPARRTTRSPQPSSHHHRWSTMELSMLAPPVFAVLKRCPRWVIAVE